MKTKIEPRMPKAEGMNVLEYGYYPMKYVVSTKDGNNYARLRGTNNNKCQAFGRAIKNGTYNPEYYIPPVGIKKGKFIHLVTGNHRYRGHELAGATEMYIAIVEFFDTKGMSAAYWKLQYQSNENKENDNDIRQLVRQEEDIVSITKTLIDRQIINDSDNDIERALEDQGFSKTSDRGKNLKNLVKASLGKTTGVTKLYSISEASEFMKTRYDITSVDTITRTMKDSTGYDGDYDPRMVRKIVDHVKSSDRNLKVGIHWTGLNPDEIIQTRQVKRNVLKNEYEKAKEFVKLFESGKIEEQVELRFLPQIDTDFADVA